MRYQSIYLFIYGYTIFKNIKVSITIDINLLKKTTTATNKTRANNIDQQFLKVIATQY
jgi:hypothetical protein